MEGFVTQRSPGDCVGGAKKKEEDITRLNNEAKGRDSESDLADRVESVESAGSQKDVKGGNKDDVTPPVIVISRADAEDVEEEEKAKDNVDNENSSDGDGDPKEDTQKEHRDEREEGVKRKGEEAADDDGNNRTLSGSILPEELSMISIEQRADPEELEEADWSLITQWSSRDRGSDSEEGDDGVREAGLRRGSPVEEDGQQGVSSTYRRLGDEITFDSPPLTPKEGVDIKYDSTTPLDPISERDESDEDGEAATKAAPSRLKAKLSSAMNDLLSIGQDDSAADDSIRSDATETAGAEEEAGKADEEKERSQSVGEESGGSSESEEESGSGSESGEGDKDTGKDANRTPAEDGNAQASGEPPKEGEKKRTKRGRITKKRKASPIHLPGALRTFSNPISYLGGPNIEYEEVKEGRERQDSVTSITSLD